VSHLFVKQDFSTAVGRIDAERAIAELRAGRPVVLRHEAVRLLVLAAETLDTELAESFDLVAQGGARLLMTAQRLRRLGHHTGEAGAIAIGAVDSARVRALVGDQGVSLDADVRGLSPLEAGALELVRLAQLLPAALVADAAVAEVAFPSLLGASLASVATFRAAGAGGLRIVSRAPVPLEGAPESEFVVFRGGEGLRDQVAIIVGAPDLSQPVTVRLHSACLTGDLFGSLKCDCGDQLRYTARHLTSTGGGVLLYLDQEGRGNGLANKIRAYDLQAQGYDTYDADAALGFDHDHRTFDFAASMLKQLGVRRVRAMTNNPEKIAALAAAGLEVVSDRRILGRRTEHNIRYLAAKRDKAGHMLDLDHLPA